MNAVLIYKQVQDVQIEIDGPTLADLFWDMDAEEQARFFNRLEEQPKLVFQLQSVTDHERLTIRGRHAMQSIGTYGPEDMKMGDGE